MLPLSLALFWAIHQRIKEDKIPAGLELALQQEDAEDSQRGACVKHTAGQEVSKAVGKQSRTSEIGTLGRVLGF